MNSQPVYLDGVEQGDLLARIVNSSVDGIIAFDLECRYTLWNAAMGRISGMREEAVLGKCAFEVFPFLREIGEDQYFYEALNGRSAISSDRRFAIPESGTSGFFEGHYSPVRDEQGDVIGGVAVIRDITERKKAAETAKESEVERAARLEAQGSEARTRRILEANVIGLLVADFEGNVMEANDEFLRIVGYSGDELRRGELNFLKLTPSEYRPFDEAAIESLRRDGRHQPFEKEYLRKDGTRAPVLVGTALLDHSPPTGVGFILDLTERKRVEEALRASEMKFRRLIEQSPLSTQVYAADGKPISGNRAWERLFGVSHSDILDYNILQDQQLVERGIMPLIRRAFAGESVTIPPIPYAPDRGRYQGQKRWCGAFAYPVKDDDGNVEQVVLVHEDITERKTAEEALARSERLYRGIGESINYGIWICDAEGRNTYASQSFLELLGITQEQCSVFGWGDALHAHDAEATIAAWQECVKTGSFWEREHRFKGLDGNWHFVLARGVPIRDDDGQVVCWAGINLDIDAIKNAEEALRDSLQRLQEAERRKDEFLAILAHELRNPLAPIRNAVQLVEIRAPADAELRWSCEVIVRQVTHLTRLIDDLLDISRITRNKLELRRQRIELAEVLRHALEASRPVIDQFAHELSVTLPGRPVYLNGDLVRLAQVVLNLLNNAAKYTPRGGKIELRAHLEGDEVVVSITDSGIGIDKQHLSQIFEMFSQVAPALERSQGGLGIGLALVKGLVEMHSGTVRAHSAGLGTGSAFTVRLPTVQEAFDDLPRSQPSATQQAKLKRRLLVVDDNRDAADSLAATLRLVGHESQTAYGGLEALERISELRPDVVLLDIGMPDLNGYETAARIQRARVDNPPLLIALTGWGQDDDRDRTRRAGFAGHLVKPVDFVQLREMIEHEPR